MSRPRLLARVMGYTQDPTRAIDDLPVIDDDILEDLTARAHRAQQTRQQEHAQHRQQQPYAVRLERARAQARLIGAQVDNEIRLVRLAMRAGRKPAHIERRLQTLEQRVFPQ